MAQWVKDLVLSLLWLRLLPWHKFDPWSEKFRVLWVQPKRKKGEYNSCGQVELGVWHLSREPSLEGF